MRCVSTANKAMDLYSHLDAVTNAIGCHSAWLRSNECALSFHSYTFRKSGGAMFSEVELPLRILRIIFTFLPILVTILLTISCCFSISSRGLDLRLAVDTQAQAMLNELESHGTAPLSTFGRGFFMLDLLLMPIDLGGDVFSAFTFVATGHVWFGIVQGLIRGVRGHVVGHRRELASARQFELRANTLTDGLYDLVNAKTVEGTLSSFLLAYALMWTIDSPFAALVTGVKWLLSLRSLTNGCYILFQLVPSDTLTTPFLPGLIWGKNHVETE